MISVLLGGKFIPFTFIVITGMFGFISTVLFCASYLLSLFYINFIFFFDCLHFLYSPFLHIWKLYSLLLTVTFEF